MMNRLLKMMKQVDNVAIRRDNFRRIALARSIASMITEGRPTVASVLITDTEQLLPFAHSNKRERRLRRDGLKNLICYFIDGFATQTSEPCKITLRWQLREDGMETPLSLEVTVSSVDRSLQY